MTWAKLDDLFPENEKVAGLSDAAFRLYIHGICYAARNLTDGKIPSSARRGLGGTMGRISELLDAGLWEIHEGGWLIHDYLEYNPSREQVLAQRQQKASAGRKGGVATAQASAVARATPSGKAPVPDPSPTPTPSSSSSSDPSDHPQKPPPPAAKSVVSFLSTAKRNEQVAALIDLAKVNDVTLKGGPAAAIVRDYGHGREVIDAFFAYLANRGVGEVHEYMIGVLRGRASRTATGYRRTGEQAGAQMEMAGEGEAALTWEQYQTILKEQGLQSTRAGAGHDSEQDTPDPVPEREAGGRAVQRTGGDDG